MLIVNVPALIRIVQCIKRYRENYEAYPHLANMGKYLSSLPPTALELDAVRKSQFASNFFICTKIVEVVYKLYWDICEDWALFSGGTGVKQFRQ